MLRTPIVLVALLTAAMGATLALQQAPPQQPRAAPRMEPIPILVDPPLVDFGVVTPGSKHPATFTLKNVGANALTVDQALPSCKCTDITPNIDGMTLKPGDSVKITATLQLPMTPGEKDAKVMVSIVGMKGLVLANMKGDVTLPVRAKPAYLDALKGKNSGTIQLSAVDGKPFRILSAGGAPVTTEAAAVHSLPWSLAGVAPATLQQWWVVETDRADCPLIPLRIRHEMTGSKFDQGRDSRWWFPPDSVIIAGRMKAGTPIELPVTIEHVNPADQGRVTHPTWGDVKAVRVPGAEGTVELLRTTKRGENFVDIVFKFTPAATLRGVHYVPVEIETATGRGLVYVSVTVDP